MPIGDCKVQMDIARPFLKWAGGKGQHLKIFENMFPTELAEGKIKTYIEPFVGGGAVLFHVLQHYDIEKAYINDINAELTNCYKCIKKDVQRVIERLSRLEKEYLSCRDRAKYFYDIRAKFNKSKLNGDFDFDKCAEFIFLNRTCFNGLHRVNRSGEFNVPHGSYKNPLICDKENLILCSEVLKKVEIFTGGYEQMLGEIDKNTFVYFDPPYRPLLKSKSFNSFDKSKFGDEEQRALAERFKRVSRKGVFLMLSTSDPKNADAEDDFFDELYKAFDIERIFAKRIISAQASRRGSVTEIVVRNYTRRD